jgi:hypothetical protein
MGRHHPDAALGVPAVEDEAPVALPGQVQDPMQQVARPGPEQHQRARLGITVQRPDADAPATSQGRLHRGPGELEHRREG